MIPAVGAPANPQLAPLNRAREAALFRQYTTSLQVIGPILDRLGERPMVLLLQDWRTRFLQAIRGNSDALSLQSLIDVYMGEFQQIVADPRNLQDAPSPDFAQIFEWARRQLEFPQIPVERPRAPAAPILNNDAFEAQARALNQFILRRQEAHDPVLQMARERARVIVANRGQEQNQIVREHLDRIGAVGDNLEAQAQLLAENVQDAFDLIQQGIGEAAPRVDNLEAENREIEARIGGARHELSEVERIQLQKQKEINDCKIAIARAEESQKGSGGGSGGIFAAIGVVILCLALNYATGGAATFTPTPGGGMFVRGALLVG